MVLQDLPRKMASLPALTAAAIGGFSLLLLFAYILKGRVGQRQGQGRNSNLRPLPEVPGIPVLGNLHQLKEKKPHKTFTNWAETYGPVYSIKTGASTIVVLNSAEVAKEAMVTRYSSISSRKLSKALDILTSSKCMVAMSDYDEFHKMVKKYILNNVLGPSAQKRLRGNRDNLVENISKQLNDFVNGHPCEPVNFRRFFQNELFALSLKQALGDEVKAVYVEELGTTLSKDEIFKVLVLDMMHGAIEVDWRDFFPYLQWVPNKAWEDKIKQYAFRRKAVTNALIREQKKRIATGKDLDSYTDFLLREAKTLTEDQITILVWEAIIEAADTTLITTEWALYELAKNPLKQELLYQEIQKVCGSQKLTEDHIAKIPYLSAVFHETLRKHSPVPVVPLRYAHEDTELGGYFVPAGSQIAINIYGCNMDKNQYENPLDWIPERFLDGKYDEADLFKTMAFGGGKRVCAGALQASLISCAAIGRLVQDFEWRLMEGEQDNEDTISLTTHKLHPMLAKLKPRRSREEIMRPAEEVLIR
ncbi:hypothetical protein MLD38_022287 [Melastoma candidum]|uniref:Uncharacterized protein n=1 Tax=Melastoma candidum TaxID=119954 RepID=A0ACB9QIT8_9MYRT|nr:hypothetical protein MLD38_022287 [Melastoma candidum]